MLWDYPQSGKTYILNSHRIKSVSVSVSLDRINSKQIRKCKCKSKINSDKIKKCKCKCKFWEIHSQNKKKVRVSLSVARVVLA